MRPLSLLLVVAALIGAPDYSHAGVSETLDATCRIHAPDGSTGTGCVFEISQGRAFILTNRHVVGNANAVKCIFWKQGHQSAGLSGAVIARGAGVDVAIVSVPQTSFGGHLPRVIPIAPRGTKLNPGDTITSAGCAKGAWATGWKGHVLGYDDGNLCFTPPPANGRSGSAVCDAKGERIVGLIWGRQNSGQSRGFAVSLENLYRTLRFTQTAGGGWAHSPAPAWTYDSPKLAPTEPSQCGPRGCPAPQPNPSQLLPYRRYEERRMDRLEDKVDRVWPTLPGGSSGGLAGPSMGSSEFQQLDRHLSEQDRTLDAIGRAVQAELQSLEKGVEDAQVGIAEKITKGLGGSVGGVVLGGLKSLLAKIGIGGGLLGGILVFFGVRMARGYAHTIAGAVDKLTDVIPGNWDDAILDNIAYKVADAVGTDTAKKARAEARKVVRAEVKKPAKK